MLANELLKKYLAGECSEEEIALIETWYLKNTLPEPNKLSDQEQTADIEAILSRLDNGETIQTNHHRPWLLMAGSIIVFISIGLYFFNKANPVTSTATTISRNDIPSGSNQATITLANGKKIIWDNQLKGTQIQQSGSVAQIDSNNTIAYRGTATDLIEMEYNSLSTARGQQTPGPVVLADGTKVWLNAASSLKFPTVFTGNQRLVELTGEAYFEVAKNKEKPFLVKSGNQRIEVLGTHFNVNAYADEDAIKTTLLEGSVRVSNAAQTQLRILKPNEQSVLKSTGTIKVVPIENADEAVAWKNGEFNFGGQDFKILMRTIARWYDVEIVYEYEPAGLHLGGEISRFRNVSEVLKSLSETGEVKFKIEGRRIRVVKY